MKEGRGEKKHNGSSDLARRLRGLTRSNIPLSLFFCSLRSPNGQYPGSKQGWLFFPLPLVVSLGREASLRKVSILHPRGISFKAPLYYLPRGNICALTRFGLYSLFGVTPLPQTNNRTTKLQDPPMSCIVHSNRLIALRMKAHRK
jgi:hypothetical protein